MPATFNPPQPDLFTPVAEDITVKWLENLLRDAGCWMTAGDIALTTRGVTAERKLRELASASDAIISGQKGYKHIDHATPEESSHAANWLEAQAKKMSDRACRIRRAAHRRIG